MIESGTCKVKFPALAYSDHRKAWPSIDTTDADVLLINCKGEQEFTKDTPRIKGCSGEINSE